MNFDFKNPLAYRIFGLALKIERFSKKNATSNMEENKLNAELQQKIETYINNIFDDILDTENKLKKIRKEDG